MKLPRAAAEFSREPVKMPKIYEFLKTITSNIKFVLMLIIDALNLLKMIDVNNQ